VGVTVPLQTRAKVGRGRRRKRRCLFFQLGKVRRRRAAERLANDLRCRFPDATNLEERALLQPRTRGFDAELSDGFRRSTKSPGSIDGHSFTFKEVGDAKKGSSRVHGARRRSTPLHEYGGSTPAVPMSPKTG
jgi:hypothetical protein